jgi:hypothetical protein
MNSDNNDDSNIDNIDNIDNDLYLKSKETVHEFMNDKDYEDKEKIIKMLEIEYDLLEKQQSALFYSNEELANYDDDYDAIESRAENMKYINKNITRMEQIKQNLLSLDNDHYINGKDIYDCFDKKYFPKKYIECEENENNIYINEEDINKINIDKEEKRVDDMELEVEKKNNVITEIDL